MSLVPAPILVEFFHIYDGDIPCDKTPWREANSPSNKQADGTAEAYEAHDVSQNHRHVGWHG